jgi:hypothetical protein
LVKSDIDPKIQQDLLDMHGRNEELSARVKGLEDKLSKAKDVSAMNHPTLTASSSAIKTHCFAQIMRERSAAVAMLCDIADSQGEGLSTSARQGLEAQVSTLQAELSKAKVSLIPGAAQRVARFER